MIHSPVRSYGLVFFQFFWIGLLTLNIHWLTLPYWVYDVQLFAVALGVWGVLTMRLGHFNVVPDPQAACQLVDHGPYRWIRHPMYASILLFFTPIALVQPTLSVLTETLLLWLTLLLKLHYEERLLSQKIACYRDYQQRSYKLIPFIF
jgi:protein-S-isoprenylcysteine O-methyltransferase Ste14